MYAKLAQKLIYPLGDLFLGTTIVKSLRQLNQSQWWSESQITQFQEEKLQKLLEHAYNNVPYYRTLFDRCGVKPSQITSKDDLIKIPILTKKDVKENFPHSLVAHNIPRKKIRPGMTGGSTGRPLQFYRYVDSTSLDWGATLRAWGWAGYCIGDKYATLWGHPLTLKEQSRFTRRIQNLFMRNLLLSAYDMDSQTLDLYANRLQEYQPIFIRGYSSGIYLLARTIYQKGIKTIRPKAVFTTSETLLENHRNFIEQQFDCKVFDHYGSGEIHAIASECEKHSGYHISAENVIVECVKLDGTLANPGEEGELIITDLNNFVSPFIRYNIEDLGVLSARSCTCGRGLPLINSLQGRVSDIIKLPNGRLVPIGYWVVLFETIAGIDQYQVIQVSNDILVIKIVVNQRFNKDDLLHITENLTILGGDQLKIDVQIVNQITSSNSGKRRFVITEV
jgi:phenylacetate-CoA ligase